MTAIEFRSEPQRFHSGTVALNNVSWSVAEGARARFHYRIGTTDELVLNSQYGAPRFFATGYRARETDTILDVGAHIGVFSVFAARLVPRGVVHALEPGAENFELLRKNLVVNEVGNSVAHRLALGGTTGTVRLYHAPGSVGHSLYLNPGWAAVPTEPRSTQMHPKEGFEEVSSQVLEEFLMENEIREVGYMKMNIEGAEYDVLLEAPVRVLQAVRFMQVELHPAEDILARELVDRIRSAGFTTSVTWSDDPTVKGWLTAQRQ
jgi:FkbM family methyltransferase